MKKVLPSLFIIVLLNCMNLPAQNPTWLWLKSDDRAGDEYVNKVATDNQGNVFVTGTFTSDTLTLGSDLINKGLDDIFLAKYDSSGNVIWSLSVGGNLGDVGFACTLDGYGNLLLTGIFNSDSIQFGNTTLYNPTPGTAEIFLAKYTNAGNLVWVKQAGGNDTDEARAIACDQNGNIYITGGYRSSTATFGSIQMNLNGTGDVFTAKYDSAGTEIWVRGSVGSNFQEGNSIAVVNNGNVYITGMFYSNPLSFDATVLSNNGSGDLFVVAYNQSGNLQWAKSFGGSLFEESKGIIADNSGNVFITGSFKSGTINFQTQALNNSGTAGTADAFAAKLDNTGNVIWANSAFGPGDDYAQALCFDAAGYIMITGTFTGPYFAWGINMQNNNGAEDIFLEKMVASNGVNLWGISHGDLGSDACNTIASDPFGNLIYGGSFSGPSIYFYPHTANNSFSTNNFFLTKTDLLPVGLELSSKIDNSVSVAPNPFTESTVFSVKGNAPSESSILKIMDISGRQLQHFQIIGQQFIYEPQGLTNGTYLYQITHSGQAPQCGKFIIAK